MVFLVTYVVPNFAQLYTSMQAQLPKVTVILIAIGTTARSYILLVFAAVVGLIFLYRYWSRKDSARTKIDGVKLRVPLLGDIWVKYQVAQFSRVLSTLLTGGIPLGAGSGNRRGFAGHSSAAPGFGQGRQNGARGPGALGLAQDHRYLSAAFDRYD